MRFFDLHCDTVTALLSSEEALERNSLAVSFEKAQCFENWCQCFAIWINDGLKDPFGFYCTALKKYKSSVENAPPNLTSFLTVEGGTLIENDISRIEALEGDGVCALTLTWNGENNIASGASAQGGLKPFGRAVIAELNRLSMICDLSHLNKKSFFECLEIADLPMASHSCCETVHPHKRNLDDEQLRLLAQKGGIVGVCLYKEFLGGNIYEGFYKNIMHLLDLGLEEYIAIGTDFDGCDMPSEMPDISKIPLLMTYMLNKGFSQALLDKIFYENAASFFARKNEIGEC